MSPNHGGTEPLSSFRERFRKKRFASLPSAIGIGPLNSFELRFSHPRLARLPNVDGIEPVRPLSPSSNLVTRPDASVVTPCQSPSGADVFQFVSAVQLTPPVAS